MNIFGDYSSYYDEFYSSKDYKKESDFVFKVITKYSKIKVRNIISLGCGTFGHEIFLAKKGYSITGVDTSKTMLNAAQSKIDKAGINSRVNLVNKDVRKLAKIKEHDLAIAMFNVFGYMTNNQDVLRMLSSVRKNLRSGGYFLFDLWHASAVLSDRPTDRVKEVKTRNGKIFRITKTDMDIVRNVLDINFHVIEIKGGLVEKEVKETHSMRYFSVPELELFLSSSGFGLVETFNFLDLNSSADGSMWDFFALAKKL